MSQVQVCLRTVFRHIDLSVLVGTHRTGIYIDIRIQFLGGNLESPRF